MQKITSTDNHACSAEFAVLWCIISIFCWLVKICLYGHCVSRIWKIEMSKNQTCSSLL